MRGCCGVWCLALLLFPIAAGGATYYVSNGGNDANDGLSPAKAWQTLDKVNSVDDSLTEGSSILFRRGDLFRGMIRLIGNPTHVTYGAYDTGDNPIISGSVVITNWTPYSGNIWVADVSGLLQECPAGNIPGGIRQLYANGELMTIARWPNSGLCTTITGFGDGLDDGVLSSDVTSNPRNAAGYWIGAKIRIRTYTWYLDIRTVADYTADGTITFDKKASYSIQDGWGFFMDTKFEELDAEREWYYDEPNKKVYFYPPGGADPNTMQIEAPMWPVGLFIHYQDHYATVEDLTFRHQACDGVNVNDSDNVTVRNNRFEWIGGFDSGVGSFVGAALAMPATSRDILFEHNTIEHVLSDGIIWHTPEDFDVGDSRIQYNTIRNSALWPGYHATGQRGTGIKVTGNGVKVLYNVVENVGYDGIRVARGADYCEGNWVRWACATLNDGGSLTIGYGAHVLKNNILLDTIGNTEGCGNRHGRYLGRIGIGVYFTFFTDNVTVEGNTIAGQPLDGVFIDQSDNNIVRNNIIYNNTNGIRFRDSVSLNNTIENNVICGLTGDQLGFALENGGYDFGLLKNNCYYNSSTDVVMRREYDQYSLARWRQDFPLQDVGSWQLFKPFDEYTVWNNGPNVIQNSGFNSGIEGWWHAGSNAFYDTTKPGLDGPSMKIEHTSGDTKVRPNGFPVVEGDYYLLRFTTLGNGLGTAMVRFFDQAPNPAVIVGERHYSIDPNRKDHAWVWRAPITTTNAQPLISTGSTPLTYWLDSMTVEHVDALPQDITDKCRLFTNATDTDQVVDLGNGIYRDSHWNTVTGSITLDAYTSAVLWLEQVKPDLEVLDFAPTIGLSMGGTEVIAACQGLTEDCRLYIGGVACLDAVVDSTTLTAHVPPMPPGTYQVRVVDSVSGEEATGADQFTYTDNPFQDGLDVPQGEVHEVADGDPSVTTAAGAMAGDAGQFLTLHYESPAGVMVHVPGNAMPAGYTGAFLIVRSATRLSDLFDVAHVPEGLAVQSDVVDVHLIVRTTLGEVHELDGPFAQPVTIQLPVRVNPVSNPLTVAGMETDLDNEWRPVAVPPATLDDCDLDYTAIDADTVAFLAADFTTYGLLGSTVADDVNQDGMVDALDIQVVINAALGQNPNGLDCDINDDTFTDALDIQLIINTVLGI